MQKIKTSVCERKLRLHILGYYLRALPRALWKLSYNTIFYFVAYSIGAVEVLFFLLRQKFLGNKLPHFYIVDELNLTRGGQPSKSGIKTLVRAGIKTIINLRIKDFNHRVVKEYYDDMIRTVHIPFYPYEPQDRAVIEFLKIVCNPNNLPTFVHCFHGMDRTGLMVAVYRIVVQNWSKEEAIREMKTKGLHWYHRNMIDYIERMDVETIRQRLRE
ncbi:MAG: hypothetical protein A3F09_02415 [Chlamydiae bacterium RIFCSPHIGHO2_12_FULL_49_11]|nr:MAG: hypothetical protein A3F09_02415 [Chlamydiae bacterium RIFCSPHIGHO2_12_FULL_49_11]